MQRKNYVKKGILLPRAFSYSCIGRTNHGDKLTL